MSKPFVGQMVQYKFRPETNEPPVAAVVARVHPPAGDGKEWVSLWLFTELQRYVSFVEFELRCVPAAQPPEPPPVAPVDPNTFFPWGMVP